MKFAIFLAGVLAIAALDACTPKPMAAEPPVQRERLAYLKQTAGIPVTCKAGADCAGKWMRALEWVNRNSVYSIKTGTNSEIVTNGPIEPTTDSAFTVTLSPGGADGFIIHFNSSCGQHTAACVPTALELESSFNKYVMYGN